MTIDAAGLLDWADHVPGPGNKVYAEANLGIGIVFHSVEGWYAGAIGELMKPERQASWQFTLKLDGTLVQHYPVTASCWASGNPTANTSFWSMELEGVQPAPINDAQIMTAQALIAEWEGWSGKKATRSEPNKALWLHREVATRWTPNAGPTACPSERYAPLWEVLEDDMTETQLLEKLEALGLIGPSIPTLKRLDQWATQTQDKNEERFAHIESLIGTTADVPPHPHVISVTLD